ncbi:hypothetical protein CASFOL_032694 [Castilleja foliolosa]|uniref:Protein kinase domain-containing protein n=1 Tax=Castilleja foliolosa TaxID=1961234 RepID=A0ABD3C276_9LAMI
MDSSTVNLVSGPFGLTQNDENPRVKFLCSFSGSILPRPQDGKLRYVGGETRIVCVPRDISYDELMSKMRELFEGVTVLKYQQPDEDLDALVSVVNDDDVTNMMEEYDKLGSSGDGFTRLRLFLFANSDQDGSLHFVVDGDERDNERRYVDALNSLNESPDFRKPPNELGSFDDVHAAEQYFNQMSLDGGGTHGQRNMELPMAQMNLRHLTIPHLGSGQPVNQRFNEMEAPWSPAYYSPRQPEFPTSPSSSRYRAPYGEFSEKQRFDRMPEDYNNNNNRIPINAHSMYEQQQQQQPPQYPENVVLIPAGNEKSGFPGNILHVSSVYEGNSSVCENCRMTRNQVFPEPLPHLEPPPNLGHSNGYLPNSCSDCVPNPNRDVFILNSDTNMHSPYYCRDQNDPRAVYSETHGHERGWISPHQPNPWADELRTHPSLSGQRLADGFVVENGMSIRYEDQRYPARSGIDYGSQVFQDQVVTGSQVPLASLEDRGVRFGNPPTYAYGNENPYQVPPHSHIPPQSPWRNGHTPFQVGPSYETSVPMAYIRGTTESSPRVRAGVENQNPWTESSQKVMGFDGSLVPDYSHVQALKSSPSIQNLEHQSGTETNRSVRLNSSSGLYEGNKERNTGVDFVALAPSVLVGSSVLEPAFENGCSVNGTNNAVVSEEQPDARLEFLPELIASVKEAALQSVKVVKDKVKEGANADWGSVGKVDAQNHKAGVDGNLDLEIEDDADNVNHSKIELTKAEEEALDRGLQTIRNEDLEEIRELGSGTYGSVYHGKWKGSDVAIKRIKASCFAGRPSERERLIADFWKEALILSSLHHPNVVSFYGVVRDGPDGSLATVTEFMVNGSLKQFLQKKDRTIDRRKRLIIAMDSAFGMEYLHVKNIVHFDLKCENLLVNMRDPHRPVCKIGDLGLSKVKQHTLVSGGVRGTLPWMAPELLSGTSNMVTEKIDVYSFGICMWELLTGDEPYTDMHCASIIGGILNNELRPQIPTWCDPEWKALMESCWASDPAQRPSFSEIAQKLRNMAAAMNLK